ncbi:hypothetical protein ACQ4M3_00565 [Leptolyngbya sp. AN03gr2]|uniref:hypothetical protein n=1 Tax=unclassified Leptolyngbya TaxID=2650499 RepID=UPI003D31902D
MSGITSSDGSVSVGPKGASSNAVFLPAGNQLQYSVNLSTSAGSSFVGGDVSSQLSSLLEKSKATGQPQSTTQTTEIPGGFSQTTLFASSSSFSTKI